MKKVALITGSSRGIGRVEAITLARDGYAVCVNCVEREDKAQELVDMLRSNGCETMWYKADVADSTAVKQMVAAIEEKLGAVTLLVNNAGIAKQCLFQDMTEDYWRHIFDVNLNGAFNTIQAVLPHMLHEHSGCIINTSSIWGQHGASCEVAYSATKHAIIGLTRSLAQELAPTNIRVNCVAPGVIDTDMNAAIDSETMDILKDETPMNRIGTPSDIANAALFLADSRSEFITGQVIGVNGGFII